MAQGKTHLQQLNESTFAIVSADGLTNFGIVKGSDGSALLIAADIRRIDEIDDGLRRAGCNKVRYLIASQSTDGYRQALEKFRGYLSDFHGRLLVKAGRASAAELEAYMKNGAFERLGKTHTGKRNIELFAQTAK